MALCCMLVPLTSITYASNLLDTSGWELSEEKNGEKTYFKLSTSELTTKSPRSLISLMGFAFEPTRNMPIGNVAYGIIRTKVQENIQDRGTVLSRLLYDENGDVLGGIAYHVEEKTQAGDIQAMFKAASETKDWNFKGTPFAMDPERWIPVTASFDSVILYDKKTLRYFKEYGEPSVELWFALALPKDKKYLKQFMVINQNRRTYKTYDVIETAYVTGKNTFSFNEHGKESRILPGSNMEALYEELFQ